MALMINGMTFITRFQVEDMFEKDPKLSGGFLKILPKTNYQSKTMKKKSSTSRRKKDRTGTIDF